MLIFAVLVFVVVLLLMQVFHVNKSGKNHVPGPLTLPLIGSLPAFLLSYKEGQCGCELWTEWARKYGKVFHVRLGLFSVYVVTDLELSKRVLASDDWIDRPQHPYLEVVSGGKIRGIIWNNGADWKETRRYTLQTLKKFGFGKNADTDHIITQEALDIKRHFDIRLAGLPHIDVCFQEFFTVSTLNIIWFPMAGRRFQQTDGQVHAILKSVRRLSSGMPIGSDPTMAFPALRHVLPSISDYFIEEYTKILDFISKIVDQRGKFQSEENFFDVFLKDIENNIHPSITREQLILTAADLIFGGAETSSLLLEFAVLAMALNPEVQERIHDEVINAVGLERAPTYSDLPNMPFSHAAVIEVLRMANTLPQVLRCNASKDAKIGEIEVKKGSTVYINAFGHHLDPKVWESPYKFQPSRFLGADGSKINAEKVMAFGYGKRMCPGNTVGKATIFTFLTTLVQSFRLEPCPGDDLSKNWMKFTDGFTISPKKYSVRLFSRLQK